MKQRISFRSSIFAQVMIVFFFGQTFGNSVPEDRDVRCESSPRGFFCTADMNGVRACNQPNSVSNTEDTPCGANKMCGCGVLRMCSDDEERCVNKPSTPPFPRAFTVKFSGQQNSSNPGGFQMFQIEGKVWQNTDKQQKRVRTEVRDTKGNLVRISDVFTLPHGDGLKVYTHTTLPSNQKFCFSEEKSLFCGYFDELIKFSVRNYGKKNKRRRHGGPTRVYREGPLFSIARFVEKEWRLRRLYSLPRYVVPVSETTLDNAGPIGKSIVMTDLRYSRYSFSVPDGSFGIPKECL